MNKLVDLEKRDLEVIKHKDWKAFDPLLAEDFVWVDDNGFISGKRETIKYISGFDLSDYSIEGAMVTMISGDVGLLTYKLTLRGSFRGEPLQPFYVSSGYVRRGGNWLNVFSQTTLASERLEQRAARLELR